jgi:hypothetical protein
LFETAIFSVVGIFGIVAHHPSVAALGIGLLAGKAIINILPQRYSVMVRSIVGYGIGLVLIAGITVILVRYVVG